MKHILRGWTEFRHLWHVWVPLLLLTMLYPLLGLAMPLVERRLIDDVLLAGRSDILAQTVGLYAFLWLLMTASGIVGVLLRARLTERLNMGFRQLLFKHCEQLSIPFSRREHSGRTNSLFISDVPQVAGLYSTLLLTGSSSIVGIIAGVAVMFVLNWQLAIVAGILPPLIAGLATIVTRPLRPASRRVQEKVAALNERLHENLAGMREVIAFGRERSQNEQFTATQMELFQARMRVAKIDTVLGSGQSLFTLVVTTTILGFGGYLVITGQTSLGTLIAMRSLFSRIMQPAGNLYGLVSSVQKSLASADRVYAFLDQEPQVQEKSTSMVPTNVRGTVAFEGINFSYDQKHPVIRDVTFTALPGQVIALVGPSGAGKTTLVSLIARFYDPTDGRILLDGTDLTDLTLDGLRRHIGMVFQDTFLFAASIRDNIAVGREGATEEEIIEAARAAYAWEFIERLPHGLDATVGERGVHLSEGQKQRIAIARALLRNPKILILDEPTSALDARSEHLLQSALDNLILGRTTFVIAHRLATVRRADCILVLEDGQIVEQGTHHELLAQQGLYRELFDLQFQGEPPGDMLGDRRSPSTAAGDTEGEDLALSVAYETTSDRYTGRILILRNGNVVDSGTHDELMARDSVYHDLVDRHLGHDEAGFDSTRPVSTPPVLLIAK